MRYETFIAVRYLWMARKRAHTAFLSLISTLGLAVGVATLLISLSLLSGLQGKIKSRLMASSPHLLVEPAGQTSIDHGSEIASEIRQTKGTDVEELVSGIAWGANKDGHGGRPVRIRSFDKAHEPQPDKSFGREWTLPPDNLSNPIFLTRDFAASAGVFLGDQLTVVAPRTRLTPFGPVPVIKTYLVERLLAPSRDDRAPQAFLPFSEAARLFGTAGKPTAIEVFTRDTSEVEKLQTKLSEGRSGLLVKTWKEINKPLFLALRLEKIVMFATISLIIFVAALNLISSLSMLIVEKRPQVGVLRTLGATEGSILAIFLGVGLLIGLGGTALGNVIGLGVAWAADHYQLIPLPGEISYVNYLPFQIDALDVLGVNLIAIALSVLATWYPARVASRIDPIVAIREE